MPSKYKVQRPRHAGGRGLDLPAAAGAEEAPELLLIGPSSPSRLLLEGAERFKVALSVDDLFHCCGKMAEEERLSEEEGEVVIRKAGNVEASLKNPDRVGAICEDIVEHWYGKLGPLGLKAPDPLGSLTDRCPEISENGGHAAAEEPLLGQS